MDVGDGGDVSDWFKGSDRIECDLARVRQAVQDPGLLFVDLVGRMPGMTSVDLVEQRPGAVEILTNEGRMIRTGISVSSAPDRVVVDFDEEYQAGSRVTATSHFHHELSAEDGAVGHTLVISGLEAPGLLGFFYRRLGSRSMGKAFLAAWRGHLEQPSANAE